MCNFPPVATPTPCTRLRLHLPARPPPPPPTSTMSSDPSTSYSPLDDRDCTLSPFSPASASETPQLTLCCDKFKIINPKQFLYKNIFIILATYMFIPIIALHDDNKIGGITYASILIGIHVLFIIIYFYKGED